MFLPTVFVSGKLSQLMVRSNQFNVWMLKICTKNEIIKPQLIINQWGGWSQGCWDISQARSLYLQSENKTLIKANPASPHFIEENANVNIKLSYCL